ncbi:CoA-transferase subunit beta [Pseudomonas saudiphocaensis]|uniref:Glutaconate CoA-transferase subunit B n=1 Tax=Pseudomonas saudiphocaensis TaxID=1499686 RepID=A0A078M1T3_9PSED|nr:ketoacid CoA transferase [Pseudomonas saudiphocaensis]CDZ96041.1 glutaconate CoA-transferase subunit B [Pseudomonas saudiphocaensis]
MSVAENYSLAELMIVAASEAWRDNGELFASGLGVLPRLGASLAKLTHTPELLMTDSECFLVEEPIPVGPRGDYVPKYSGYLGFERVFEAVWGGRRHAMIGPTQVDRFAQTNLSAIGGDYYQPKIAMLGVRGLPGNSINHKNSFLVPNHSTRSLVAEVDMVSGVGFNPERWEEGMNASFMSVGILLTDLCVIDYNGPNHAPQVRSLHPGVSFEQVQENTGFELLAAPDMGVTPAPTEAQLEIIRRLDPHDLRSKQLKGNPPGIRQA